MRPARACWPDARFHARSDDFHEPFGVLQAALIGFMGLVLAFGLSLAVGRYESRRAHVVHEANAIGTTYLRAQTLAEPEGTASMDLLRSYTETSIVIGETIRGSPAQDRAVAESRRQQDVLWSLAAEALDRAPETNAPRRYVETFNEMFDAQTTRVYGLTNRVPTAVLVLKVVLAVIALAALLVVLLLQVTFDLDRAPRAG